MIATKSLPTNRVATLALASRAGLDPEWDHAREYLDGSRRNIAGLATELHRLRGLYLGQGQGRRTDLQPSPHGAAKVKNQEPHDATLDRTQGFQAACREQLGISDDTAYRYINAAKAVFALEQIADTPVGEVIELDGGDMFEVTEKAQEKAKELKEEIVTGGVPLNRALPAVKGLFIPGGSRGGKAATDHSKNCKAAMAKWATSLEHYYDFPTADREYLDATFGELLANGVIPESWLVMMAKQTKGGRK